MTSTCLGARPLQHPSKRVSWSSCENGSEHAVPGLSFESEVLVIKYADQNDKMNGTRIQTTSCITSPASIEGRSLHSPCSIYAVSIQCLQYPYSVYSLHTVYTVSIQCLQSPYSVYSLHTMSTVSMQCLQSPYSVYSLHIVSTVSIQCL